MKKLLVFILLLGHFSIFAAEPIVQIPQLPSKEAFDNPEEFFTIKTLEYLSYAIALQTQIMMLGKKPEVQVSIPTFEQLSDQDYNLIKKYYSIAKKLEKQVKNLDENVNRKHIEELRKRLVETQQMYDSLYFATLNQYLSSEKINFYKKNIDSLIYKNLNLAFEIDSISVEFFNKLTLQREIIKRIYNEYYKYTKPALSLSTASNLFMINNENLSNKLSVSTEVLINLNPLFDFGKYLDFWLKYSHPVFISSFIINNPKQKIEYLWNTDFYSVGLNSNIQLINNDQFRLGFKLGIGQFWGISRLFNQTSPETTFSGQELKFELNFGKNSVYTPFDIFVGFNSYFNEEIPKLKVNSALISNFGNKNFNSISLGIRFVIIRVNVID